ncbi:MAG: DUF2520 domain-containing protein [Actinobacteria bacterium]|nr:DUF2520 domain-containing protein [Actinomycetota bacterium]
MSGEAPRIRVVGRGRAGGSFARALSSVGWNVDLVAGRGSGPVHSGDTDVVLIAVPDEAVATVAGRVEPSTAVVAHCSGSLTLEHLSPHLSVASIHPLMSLSSAETGAHLLVGAWFAVAGDATTGHALALELVGALGGRPVEVPDDVRTRYHATAVVASNHLVALLGQVERLAAEAGVPLEAYHDLIAGTLANVTAHGATAALTGPAARGDWDTVRRHLADLPEQERPLYLVLAGAAADLVGRPVPTDLRVST